MGTYYRRYSREFRAILSDGQVLRIVAPTIQRAHARAQKWANKHDLTVELLTEMENT